MVALPPALSITRRRLFSVAATSAVLAAAPLAARGFGSGFTHGVASGEPSHASVLLWTRYVGRGESTKLEWVIAQDADLARPVASGEAIASFSSDYCAKALVQGLEPGRWYYYQFIAPDGSKSDVGRTRTLPDGKIDKFRLAVFSCSNYGFGHFNAYAHVAEANDADLALHLGDYIYEYGRGTYPSAGEAHPQRMLWPDSEIVALADYRLRYGTYRSDPDLRRIHQLLPMICIWDDHEFANDAWQGGAENHQNGTEGEWEVRKAAARRARQEWLPVSGDTYAAYEVGDLATLFRLDTRIEGREQPFNLGKVMAGKKSPEEIMAALAAFRNGAWADPQRQLLGAAQEGWLGAGLKRSRADGKVWQVLVQQVVMGQLATPPDLMDALGSKVPDYARARIAAAAMASKAGLPANMDAWDGYPAARERLLASALDADANLLVLAGDSHNGWAFELDHAGARAGVEFGVQSVSSPGLETYLGSIAPADLAGSLVRHNPGLKYADTAQRGYALVELTKAMASAEYRFVESVRARSTALAGVRRITSAVGSNALQV
ncbi:MAG: alkaline phosphatase [Erythrobacter sp.]|nr:alkaline phosphatase [Erythrobacter sp.]